MFFLFENELILVFKEKYYNYLNLNFDEKILCLFIFIVFGFILDYIKICGIFKLEYLY